MLLEGEGSEVLASTWLGAVLSRLLNRNVHEGHLDCKTQASCFIWQSNDKQELTHKENVVNYHQRPMPPIP